MSNVERDEKQPSFARDAVDTDDIEIIEVVGFEQEEPTVPREPSRSQEADDEIVLDLDAPAEETPDFAEFRSPDSSSSSEANERFLRLQADFENYKKRVRRDQDDFKLHAVGGLIGSLLPVLDNFERAVATSSGLESGTNLRAGVVLIFKQLLEELRRHGLVAIDSIGQTFDPRIHEAVATEYSEDHPPSTVVEELQRGYLLHDRLLRPSLVKVCLGPTEGDRSNYEGGEA